jgi:Protein of unknown function (DUF4435)
MRLDGLDIPEPAALLVEGSDDRRLFLPFARHPGLVVPCAGRTMVLAISEIMTNEDRNRMVALVDCDFEIALKNLTIKPGLIITYGTDVEADMLLLGLLERIVQHLIPASLAEPGELQGVAAEMLDRAIALAKPLGRARMAAQPLGVALEIDDFPFHRHMLASGEPDERKIIRTVHDRLTGEISLPEFEGLYIETPNEPLLCKGDDLLRAVAFIMRKKYRATNKVNSDMLNLMLRACMSTSEVFESWAVVQRIRAWQTLHSARVLRDGSP